MDDRHDPGRLLSWRLVSVIVTLSVLTAFATAAAPGELLANAPAILQGAAAGPAAEPNPPTSAQAGATPAGTVSMVDIPVAGGGTVRASSHALADIPSTYLACRVGGGCNSREPLPPPALPNRPCSFPAGGSQWE